MTGVTTQVAAGTATEVRTFNDLNQMLTNAVTPVGGGTTNWTYTYNLDGTLATKFDGTNTYAYTWDPGGDQRLLSMSLNGVTQVALTCDSMGRMLTRTPYSAGVAQTPTNFEWDQLDCVREFAPAGTYRYYAPQGELITFDYTPTAGATSTYCLHSDATYGIRAITDSTGAIVAHYETDPWGNLLASSSDISFGFNYRFVGSLGVRWDATLGMYYCRNRFYDPTQQRFISRDIPLKSKGNKYCYCANSPTNFVDIMGRDFLPADDILTRFPNLPKILPATLDKLQRAIDYVQQQIASGSKEYSKQDLGSLLLIQRELKGTTTIAHMPAHPEGAESGADNWADSGTKSGLYSISPGTDPTENQKTAPRRDITFSDFIYLLNEDELTDLIIHETGHKVARKYPKTYPCGPKETHPKAMFDLIDLLFPKPRYGPDFYLYPKGDFEPNPFNTSA